MFWSHTHPTMGNLSLFVSPVSTKVGLVVSGYWVQLYPQYDQVRHVPTRKREGQFRGRARGLGCDEDPALSSGRNRRAWVY